MKEVSTSDVEAHVAEILAAARLFREQATDLMTRLASALGAAPEDFASDSSFWVQFEQIGRLDADWRYAFHGFECSFNNEQTGQYLKVRLGFAGEFGVLDPYFFAEFIKSTPGTEDLSGLFKDSYHDGLRALATLGRRGDLKLVEDVAKIQAGWVVVDPED
jgi:hypothetical protein